MKNVLIICNNIHEINQLRRFFGGGFKIKATNSMENAIGIIKSEIPDLTLYHIEADFTYLFSFYKNLRSNPSTADMPLIVMADIQILKALTDTVELKKAAMISTFISTENMQHLIKSFLPEKEKVTEEE